MSTALPRNPELQPTEHLRRLTTRACEVARAEAAAVARALNGEPALLDSVRQQEEELDTLDRQINEDVTASISQVSEPEARELLSCLKLVIELERIGDLLLNVAIRVATVAGRIDAQDTADLRHMAALLQSMLTDAAAAFSNRDLDRALAVLRADAEMDRLRNLMFVRHIDNPENRPVQQSFHLVFVTQALERAGDHSKNVAEEVCHLVTGRSVRHLLRASDKSDEEKFIEHLRRREFGR